jgi:4-hydroxy-3-polyprenylbenzoate decarboxylase
MRRDPIYHSTYTGKPPDEPAVLGVALNEVFMPLLQKQFSEITDFYLPPKAAATAWRWCRSEAVRGPRQARDVRRLELPAPVHVYQVHCGGGRGRQHPRLERSDLGHHDPGRPDRDTTLVDNTPIDYLDFASPVSGLGSKMGIDATNKWPGETTREWGTTIDMSRDVKQKVDQIWQELGL